MAFLSCCVVAAYPELVVRVLSQSVMPRSQAHMAARLLGVLLLAAVTLLVRLSSLVLLAVMPAHDRATAVVLYSLFPTLVASIGWTFFSVGVTLLAHMLVRGCTPVVDCSAYERPSLCSVWREWRPRGFECIRRRQP